MRSVLFSALALVSAPALAQQCERVDISHYRIDAARYGSISYCVGPNAYFTLPGHGRVSFRGDTRFNDIVIWLHSGNRWKVQDAVALIEGSAVMQGKKAFPPNEGE